MSGRRMIRKSHPAAKATTAGPCRGIPSVCRTSVGNTFTADLLRLELTAQWDHFILNGAIESVKLAKLASRRLVFCRLCCGRSCDGAAARSRRLQPGTKVKGRHTSVR